MPFLGLVNCSSPGVFVKINMVSVCQNNKRKADNQQIVEDMQCFFFCFFLHFLCSIQTMSVIKPGGIEYSH